MSDYGDILDEPTDAWMSRDQRERERIRRMRDRGASPEDLRAERVRLGLDIPLDEPTARERNPSSEPSPEPAAAQGAAPQGSSIQLPAQVIDVPPAQGRPPEGSIQLPAQQIQARPEGERETEREATPRGDMSGFARGLARPETSSPRAPQDETRRRALRNILSGGATPQMPTPQAPQGRVGAPEQSAKPEALDLRKAIDPRLEEAESERSGNRTKATILALLNALFGSANPDFKRDVLEMQGDPVAEYREQRERELAGSRQAQESRREQQRYEEQMGLRREQMGLRREQLDLRRQDQEADRSLTERRVAAQERGLDIREAQARSLVELREARARAEQGDMEMQRALSDPESELSRGLQDTMMGYQERAQGRELTPAERMAYRRMPAEVLQELPGYTQMISGAFSVRRSRRGGGGGGGSIDRREVLAQQLVDTGRAPNIEQARQTVSLLGGDDISRVARGMATSSRSEDQERELLPGVRAGIEINDTEARGIRTGYAAARSQMASLNAAARIADEYGAGATISPEARAKLAPHIQSMMAMVADIRNTGIIQPGEAATIEAAIPNPSNLEQMTFGTFRSRLGEYRRLLAAKVNAGLEARGVDAEGRRRALRALLGGGFGGGGEARREQPSQPQRGGHGGQQGGMVRVRRPDGSTGRIPRSALEQARERGWEVLE